MFFSENQDEINQAIEQFKKKEKHLFCSKCLIKFSTRYRRMRLPTREQAVAFLCESCEIPETEYERRCGH